MIASLPMYWRPETAAFWQRFWRLVQDHIDAPDLSPPDQLPSPWARHWLDPQLALSMTCSLPFRTNLRDRVQYLGTLDFDLGDTSGHYHSKLIMRTGDTDLNRPLRFAFNGPDSQSGWAVRHELPLNISETIETGGHSLSLVAVAQGRADAALIDAVTWRMLQPYDPNNAAKVQVVTRTKPTPGLPFIAASGHDPEPMIHALRAATKAFTCTSDDTITQNLSFVWLGQDAYLNMSSKTT